MFLKNYNQVESFNATYKNGKIQILSNTSWRIKSEGTINLSQYSGEGIAEIDVMVPYDIPYGSGNVYFSYGSNHCSTYNRLYVYIENKDYFKAVPNYVCLSGSGSTAIVSIFSTNGFKVQGVSTRLYSVVQIGGNKLLIISNTDSDFGCDGDVDFFVDDLLNPNKTKVKVYQCLEKETKNYCVLYATYSKVNENTYQINVDSVKNGEYALFTWDDVDGVTITKVNNYTLNVVVNNIYWDSLDIVLHNECSDFDLTIRKEPNDVRKIFDVSVKCNGNVGSVGGETELSIVSKTISPNDDINQIISDNQKITNDCN